MSEWTKTPPSAVGSYWCRRVDTGFTFVVNIDTDDSGRLVDLDDHDPCPLAEAFFQHEWFSTPIPPPNPEGAK